MVTSQRIGSYSVIVNFVESLNNLSHGMCSGPFPSGLYRSRLILLPALSDIICKRVIWVWSSEQGLDREQNCTDLERRGPVV